MRVVQLVGINESWLAAGTGSFVRVDDEGPELVIVRSGSIELRNADGGRRTLGRGRAILVQPGDNAEVVALEDTSLTRILLPADCTLE